jgi:hypothetical protein
MLHTRIERSRQDPVAYLCVIFEIRDPWGRLLYSENRTTLKTGSSALKSVYLALCIIDSLTAPASEPLSPPATALYRERPLVRRLTEERRRSAIFGRANV